MKIDTANIAALDFAKGQGLIAAVVQHAVSRAVLMLGYMNQEALQATLERRRVVFFSRTRETLWEKGETSGNTLDLVSISADCDRDTILIEALPHGPVCHTGTDTCFGATAQPAGAEAPGGMQFLSQLEAIIAERAAAPAAESPSYTARLLHSGAKRIAQKVGEEGVEVALAAVAGDANELISESADLVFHLLVLLRSRGLTLAEVIAELERRHPLASDARRSASLAS